MGAQPSIELLWWPGCPSRDEALAELRGAMRELGLDPDALQVIRLDTEEDAARERFAGSPTFRVAGEDVLPPGGDEPTGLTCRLYRRRDGRPSPTPDPADLRDALAAAIRRKELADV
jgi:hypothetical protein